MIDNRGRKKFDKTHMTKDGNLPNLINYEGRKFDILDTLGFVDKDENDHIKKKKSKKGGYFVDNEKRRINRKGYLIDDDGNVIDKSGELVFRKAALVDDEIPKLFESLTKFDIESILGDFEKDIKTGDVKMSTESANGNTIDKHGSLINRKGYLIDSEGNVIDKQGRLIFKKALISEFGEIPAVFKYYLKSNYKTG